MKDKIIVVIISALFIGMVWISGPSNSAFSNNPVISEKTIHTEDSKIDFIDYEVSETALFNETKLHSEISAKNICTLKSIETDVLSFGEAFGYYQQCLGSDSSFMWKNMEYNTLLSDEIILQVADSFKVNGNSKEEKVSQIR